MAQNNTIHIINCNVQEWLLPGSASGGRVYVEAEYVTEDYVE